MLFQKIAYVLYNQSQEAAPHQLRCQEFPMPSPPVGFYRGQQRAAAGSSEGSARHWNWNDIWVRLTWHLSVPHFPYWHVFPYYCSLRLYENLEIWLSNCRLIALNEYQRRRLGLCNLNRTAVQAFASLFLLREPHFKFLNVFFTGYWIYRASICLGGWWHK